MTKIESFSGDYRFLSNFWPCIVQLDGLAFPSVEHAYQAAKTMRRSERERIAGLPTAGEAKRFSRRIVLRPDWESVKLQIMHDLVRQKFQEPRLKAQLLSTGTAELVAGNWWNDRYWGVCREQGENNLGKILMHVRKELRDQE